MPVIFCIKNMPTFENRKKNNSSPLKILYLVPIINIK